MPTSRAKTAYGLLSEICKLIVEEPLRYYQGDWIRREGDNLSCFLPAKKYPSCGTVGCVAGWVATLKRRHFSDIQTESIAQKVLGLSGDQTIELFSGSAVSGVGQTQAHARAGVRHIRRFQKKYLSQLLAKKV
jgi:hypothetical protein